MLLSLILIAVIAVGGMMLTYLIADDEPILWRLSAGLIIGSSIFGFTLLLIASAAGLTPVTVFLSLGPGLAPVLLLRHTAIRKQAWLDWQRAKGKLQGATALKGLRFAYYAFFLILFWFFFERAMFETAEGLFTGASNNLGDLPFHLGAIFSFTDGNNFPPENPSFAGTKFSYPLIADLITAAFVKFGADVKDAMLLLNVSWAMALLVIFERFVLKFTGDRHASKIAPALLFFSGGFGFIWFFGDFAGQSNGFLEFVTHLRKDYTIGEMFRWGNSLVTLFITQRSILLGMPLTIIVVGHLWEVFTDKTAAATARRVPLRSIAVGAIAGLLPLIHLHSLAVLFVVTLFVLVLRRERWRDWIAFGIGVSSVALPQLIWSMAGSATRVSEFIGWHFGWDKGDKNFVWFWLINTGIFIPLAAAGMYLVYLRSKPERLDTSHDRKTAIDQLCFFLPFGFIFLLANAAKFAPWEWDNIKLLIYWFIGAIPFAAIVISFLWRRGGALTAAAVVCFVVLTLSGALDVWRTASAQVKIPVFTSDAVNIARRIRQYSAPTSLFLNAPTYNSAVVLTGRRSVMRYSGHLGSHGIDYAEREADVKLMYQGGDDALRLFDKYGVDYVLISPEETSTLQIEQPFFDQFPVIAESGTYKIYKVKTQ
ncbi:MAG: hypothetical protein WBD22_04875 [Pyrinomonadaceae bacterium]